ncbi:maleylpyruvate isomerase family mycothiol-dependent enzyme [Amycolatopsis sp. NPDC004368]
MSDLPEIQQRELDALVEDLSALAPQQWRAETLCADWDVEEVVSHLGGAAATSRPAWFRSMFAARFDAALHNRRRLEDFRGSTPAETLERFRHVGPIASPIKPSPAGLGEVIVHSADIRKPLGLTHDPDPAGLLAVARFFASKNFAVNSKTVAKGLTLHATDADFTEGTGPDVRGPLLSLVMVLAGRAAFLPDLSGDGVAELRNRLAS